MEVHHSNTNCSLAWRSNALTRSKNGIQKSSHKSACCQQLTTNQCVASVGLTKMHGTTASVVVNLAMLYQWQLTLFLPQATMSSVTSETAGQWKCCNCIVIVSVERLITMKLTLLRLPDSWRGWEWTHVHHIVHQLCTVTLILYPKNKTTPFYCNPLKFTDQCIFLCTYWIAMLLHLMKQEFKTVRQNTVSKFRMKYM